MGSSPMYPKCHAYGGTCQCILTPYPSVITREVSHIALKVLSEFQRGVASFAGYKTRDVSMDATSCRIAFSVQFTSMMGANSWHGATCQRSHLGRQISD